MTTNAADDHLTLSQESSFVSPGGQFSIGPSLPQWGPQMEEGHPSKYMDHMMNFLTISSEQINKLPLHKRDYVYRLRHELVSCFRDSFTDYMNGTRHTYTDQKHKQRALREYLENNPRSKQMMLQKVYCANTLN